MKSVDTVKPMEEEGVGGGKKTHMSNCTVKIGLVCFVCTMGSISYDARF